MPVYLRVNDRPPSSIATALYLWPSDWAHGLTVDVYDAVPESPVVVASAEFPAAPLLAVTEVAPTARMAFVFRTASTRLFRTGVVLATAGDIGRGSVSECIEVLPAQRIVVDVASLGFERPVVGPTMTIPPPKGISVVESGPPLALRVLGTAVDASAGVVSYDLVLRMEPAASPTDTDEVVDLTVLDISVTPNAVGGLPLVGTLANAIGQVVSDRVAVDLRRSIRELLQEMAEGVFVEDIPDDDVRMTVQGLDALSPTSFEVAATVGAVDGCARANAAWSRFWTHSVVPAASDLFATDHAGAGALLADVRDESLAALRMIADDRLPVARRGDRLSGRELHRLLRSLAPVTSVRVANLVAVAGSGR